MVAPLRSVFLLASFVPCAAMSVASQAARASRPARVVLEPALPTLYIYDHCPFCVRVRFALGVKNVKHDLRFMMNDDATLPKSLVGKKVAPIWQVDDHVMGESMDIIRAVDSDERFGPTGYIQPGSDRSDIADWQKKYANAWRLLQRPRYVHDQSILPEFQQQEGREYYMRGHYIPLDDHDKASFAALSKEEIQAYYDRAMEMTEQLLEEVNPGLLELEAMLHSEESASPGGISYDDVDLWARLRSISLVRGLQVPPKVDAYMKTLSALSDVPLYWSTAM